MLIIKTVPKIERILIGIVCAVAFMVNTLFTQDDITLKTIACDSVNIYKSIVISLTNQAKEFKYYWIFDFQTESFLNINKITRR